MNFQRHTRITIFTDGRLSEQSTSEKKFPNYNTIQLELEKNCMWYLNLVSFAMSKKNPNFESSASSTSKCTPCTSSTHALW